MGYWPWTLPPTGDWPWSLLSLKQKVLLRTLLSSFLHNCQHSLRTDCHAYLLSVTLNPVRSLSRLHANWPQDSGSHEQSLPLSKAQKNEDETRVRLSCWTSSLLYKGQSLFIRHRASWLLICPTARQTRTGQRGGGGGSARLRRTLPPHTGEDSSASGASVLGELYAQLTQGLFNAQCSLSPEGR